MYGFEHEMSVFIKFLLYICSASIILSPVGVAVVSKVIYLINTKIRNIYVDESRYLLAKTRVGSAIITIVFILGVVYFPFAFLNCGTYDFGSIFEKNSYTEDFYVYVGERFNTTKQYKVKATIRKTSFKFEPHYYIKKLYLSNGGYISFADDISLGEEVYPYVQTEVTDYNSDESYYVMLTNQKAS
ncbi:MAG: hypothetical protein IJF32_11570 [Oscillospiraceae bacterium]|nr:hypothetical protein [Oscillospiraceae bacterium]